MANGGRSYCGILYPDAENYNCDDVLETIRNYFDKWAYVLHDKDVLPETGEQKKPHYHWVGSLAYPVEISTVIRRLDIPGNYVEAIRKKSGKTNWKGAVRYLVHDADPDKYQYLVKDVVSNFDILRYLGSGDEVLQIQRIIGFIDEHPNCCIREVFDFAVANGCYKEFKSARWVILDILKEKRGKEVV